LDTDRSYNDDYDKQRKRDEEYEKRKREDERERKRRDEEYDRKRKEEEDDRRRRDEEYDRKRRDEEYDRRRRDEDRNYYRKPQEPLYSSRSNNNFTPREANRNIDFLLHNNDYEEEYYDAHRPETPLIVTRRPIHRTIERRTPPIVVNQPPPIIIRERPQIELDEPAPIFVRQNNGPVYLRPNERANDPFGDVEHVIHKPKKEPKKTASKEEEFQRIITIPTQATPKHPKKKKYTIHHHYQDVDKIMTEKELKKLNGDKYRVIVNNSMSNYDDYKPEKKSNCIIS
jgi:hypothetical protein